MRKMLSINKETNALRNIHKFVIHYRGSFVRTPFLKFKCKKLQLYQQTSIAGRLYLVCVRSVDIQCGFFIANETIREFINFVL